MLDRMLNALFGCSHRNTTFPLTPHRRTRPNEANANPYVACLDCGAEFEYDWNQMRIRKSVSMVTPTKVQVSPVANLVDAR